MEKKTFTLYMPEDVSRMFNELYAYNVIAGAKESKSDIICNALREFYKKFNRVKGKGTNERNNGSGSGGDDNRKE